MPSRRAGVRSEAQKRLRTPKNISADDAPFHQLFPIDEVDFNARVRDPAAIPKSK